ncbi:MAG: nucleotidyl transferase AbiEii/AbiGii toxin family protein [Sulfuritalea sp.]|nr:nucleotidyl transferase AbiEii/AbiGii toxin family protein [Sulfuritalea sp.]
MDTAKLPPDTRRIWEKLEISPLLTGFVLIGGTALTIRIGHRISEDLDFAFLGDLLPVLRLRQLVDAMRKAGIDMQLNQDAIAEQEFVDSGLLLEEHQQNYIADNAVKVSFVRLDNPTTGILSGTSDSPLRVATLDEVFKTKALVCAERSKTRDWFDLYIMMTRHGYEASDLYRAFQEADRAGSFQVAELRLRACKASATDEGYLQMVKPAPTLDELRQFFNEALDRLQVTLSKIAFANAAATARTSK